MKKIFTLLFLSAITISSFAQVELAVKSVQPDELVSTRQGTPLPLIVTLENNGTNPIPAGDTIAWNVLVLNPEADPSQALLLQFPNGAVTGNLALHLVSEAIAPGGTYDIDASNLSANLFTRNSIEVLLAVRAYHFDRTNPLVDTDSTNNLVAPRIIWYNEYRNGVSVDEINQSNKIAAYPNPANEVLNIEVRYGNIAETTVELIDLTGKTIKSNIMSDIFYEGVSQLDVADVENGIYIVKVTNGDDVSTSKVTISH